MMGFIWPLVGAIAFYERAEAVYRFAPGYAILGYIVSSILLRVSGAIGAYIMKSAVFNGSADTGQVMMAGLIGTILFFAALILSAVLPFLILKPKSKPRSFKEFD
jgi:hypothetical protein